MKLHTTHTTETIAVDHRPVLKIFGDRSLDHISNTRLKNLKEKTLRYHFKLVHIPGTKNRAPDTLSRHWIQLDFVVSNFSPSSSSNAMVEQADSLHFLYRRAVEWMEVCITIKLWLFSHCTSPAYQLNSASHITLNDTILLNAPLALMCHVLCGMTAAIIDFLCFGGIFTIYIRILTAFSLPKWLTLCHLSSSGLLYTHFP